MWGSGRANLSLVHSKQPKVVGGIISIKINAKVEFIHALLTTEYGFVRENPPVMMVIG